MATKYKKIIKQDDGEKIICQNPKCKKMGKHLTTNDFYKSRSEVIQHHPFCKDCVNDLIDINNIDTVLDVLKTLDTPFIADIWNEVINKKDNNYIGEYLMLINFTYKRKYSNFRFKDSIFEMSDEISEDNQIQPILDDIPVWVEEWQGNYNKKDLKYLNDYFTSLQNDFKIVTINHRDYAKKIAKASLAADKAFTNMLEHPEDKDAATVYKNAIANFDTLSKTAQFAESQRGANDVSLGCFGRVFDLVEKHTWVPPYEPSNDDQDIYDKLLKQFSNIEKSL